MEVAAAVGIDRMLDIAKALLILVVGLMLARVAARTTERLLLPHQDRQAAMLARKGVFWFLTALVAVTAMHQLGFNLGVLLGAAGILTVAIGFASQTSASNLISGMFLLGEKPFAVGDMITVGDVTGEVLSIDALSVKLRTFDNIFVRIPNESILKDRVRTISKFPIRRFDLKLTVGFEEDLTQLETVLRAASDANKVALQEPKPLFMLLGYEEWGIGVQFSVWAARPDFFALRTSLTKEVQQALKAAGVRIPYRRIEVSGYGVGSGRDADPGSEPRVESGAADVDRRA
ncbi:MAG: mechanosensitive ion channel family protein [Gammaproteobacteria bacterium]|nr:mechanosensitive ion channel family protein [Gammaproteobacteria bacterium]